MILLWRLLVSCLADADIHGNFSATQRELEMLRVARCPTSQFTIHNSPFIIHNDVRIATYGCI